LPVLLRSLKYLKPHWRLVVVTKVALLLSTLTSLIVPYLNQQAIDLGLARGDVRLMALIGGGLIGVGLLRALINFVQRGQHEELLAQGGLYKETHDLQLRDQEQLCRELAWLSEAAEDDGRKPRPAARKQAHEFAV